VRLTDGCRAATVVPVQRTPVTHTTRSTDIAIIGGGIIGCATARELARLGRHVVVLESEQVGYGASSRNSGMIRISGRETAELPLISRAISLWTELALLPGVDFDYVRAGSLWVAETEQERTLLERIVERQERAGVHVSHLLGRQATMDMLPALGDFARGALFGTLDGHADQRLATRAMGALATTAGAEIRSGVAVHAIERKAGTVHGLETSVGFLRAETVLLAAGAWSPPLALTAGRRLAIAIRRGQAMQTRPLPRITHLALIAPQPAGGHVALRQLRSGAVTISGFQRPEFVGYDQEPTETTLRLNREAADRALPGLADAEIEMRWAGLNEATLDTLPLLGPDPSTPGLFIATGFSGHGFGIAPAVGELMANLIVSGQTPLPIQPFRVDRFDHLDIDAALERFKRIGVGSMYTTGDQAAPALGQG
jgi:glycine/D-amino acid oxidase-like deaminating enzyme